MLSRESGGSKNGEHQKWIKHIINSQDSLGRLHQQLTKPGETRWGVWGAVASWWTPSSTQVEDFFNRARRAKHSISDVDFLAGLDENVADQPLLQPLAARAIELAHEHFENFLTQYLHDLQPSVERMQEQRLQDYLKQSAISRAEKYRKSSVQLLIQQSESETPYRYAL